MTKQLDVRGLYGVVAKFFGDVIQNPYFGSTTATVGGVLYETFELRCSLDDRYASFGASIRIGPHLSTTTFFGRSLSRESDPDTVRQSLATIDRWCRAHLSSEFLSEYERNVEHPSQGGERGE